MRFSGTGRNAIKMRNEIAPTTRRAGRAGGGDGGGGEGRTPIDSLKCILSR
ncbi:MAG: hypothetical protein O8C64_02380 [Candidatus Methanoperedens sp.]|nr:hypothetical protein [Candidatus Methanoperedens sp.]MCZ7405938.1 hypothetical protein [Candidatus Methanoperedens sp.]